MPPVEEMSYEKVADIVEEMDSDDAVDFLEELDEDEQKEILPFIVVFVKSFSFK